jgi:hypothetical protein
MVAEGHRLGGLQVREAGHDGVGVRVRLGDERALERLDLLDGEAELLARPEPHVERDLVVARARGVEPAGGRADLLMQARLDVHVHVLERRVEREVPRAPFGEDLVEALEDGGGVGAGDDARLSQHGGVRLRAHDIVFDEPHVGVDRSVDPRHDGVRRSGEAAAPHGISRAAGRGVGGFRWGIGLGLLLGACLARGGFGLGPGRSAGRPGRARPRGRFRGT